MDSQCVSYIIDAMSGVSRPTGALAEEKIALLRCYFYTEGTLWVTPQVQVECLSIPDPELRETHKSFIQILFGALPVNDEVAVAARTGELAVHHAESDSRILAEAEAIGMDVLLSYDSKFIARLTGKSALEIRRPSDHWGNLALPRGASPNKIPVLGNPLAKETWWRWE